MSVVRSNAALFFKPTHLKLPSTLMLPAADGLQVTFYLSVSRVG